MIRQSAFTGENKLLKGGLHCHTTRSDGSCTPEEVLQLHAEHNYDFLAITDHRRYNTKNFAPETNILIIPGMEIDACFENENGFRCFHTVCIGPDDASNGFSQDENFECPGVKTQFDFQKYLDKVHEKNNITFYCHPEWSSTPARFFDKLQGEVAMEIWNSGCAIENMMDNNAAYWDEMLGLGNKIWGVAVDDGHPKEHHCNGWVMVNAEKNVKSILNAIQNGAFYSSTGAIIKDFYIEDGIAYVKGENCSAIRFCADKHPARIVKNSDEATLELRGNYDYIRAEVYDNNGKKAWTNPIFIK